MSSIVVGFIFLALILLAISLWGVLFWLGAKWAGIEGVTLVRALLLAVAVALIRLAVTFLVLMLPLAGTLPSAVGIIALELVGGLIAVFAVLKIYVRASLGRIVLAWLPTLLAGVVSLAPVFLVVRPFLCETFIVPSNGMAPTLLGTHWTGVCPRCGAPAYATAPHESGRRFAEDDGTPPLTMICSREMTSCLVDHPSPDPASSDRFVCCKLFRPRRWDVVVFKYPAEPTKVYVQRLVGLPGETVVIEDGAVWIDGQRLDPPNGQHYLSEIKDQFGGGMPMWGTKQRPARLGPDEYFMLGDFSENSYDSRLWQAGAPGHPAYAVPESHIVGVATHIYWPRGRMRVLR